MDCNEDEMIFSDIEMYTQLVIGVMELFEATEAEMGLLTEETIQNGFRNKRHPVAVAWAVLQ